jgi:DNA helicase-2/ATP-dependent DNA helicase PcrA
MVRTLERFIPQEKEQNWLDELNPQQLEAATHGEGPLLIVAGAGTGKTRTLAYRVAYLISQGVQPERILLLTFTRRAAEEMLKRASLAISTSSGMANKVWGGTFHATANRILRMYAQAAGLSPDFTIIDRSDSEDLLDVVRHDLSLSKKKTRFPRKSTCMEIYTRKVNGNEDLEAVLRKEFPWCEMWHDELKTLFQAYVDRKQKQNILDYDDLLLYLYYMLEDEDIARSVGGRFDHILVDEYQDTNRIQAGILIGMRRDSKNITVVGDDAQSIYGFRSATVSNMLEFPSHFPGTTIVTLEHNYRSVEPILETTNRVIAQAKERYSKDLWSTRKGGQRPQLITCLDDSHQDELVINQVLEHYEQGIPLRKQAVLFRAASHSNSLEMALTRRNIPFYKYGGLRFLESAHIKDLISFLRIIENPRDETAWFRVLQLMDGIGPVSASLAIEHLTANNYNPCAIETFKAPPSASEDMEAFGELIKDLSTMENDIPSVQIERILRFYSPLLKRRYDNAEQRENDVEHLAHISTRFRSRKQFLADIILDPPSSTGDLAGPPIKDEDWLVLSTIHSAKGLEWDVVYLIHAADGCLPSDMATGNDKEIEEELRLTYVAMTRARDFLYVLWPMRFYHIYKSGRLTDNHTYAQLCRFFTDNVIDTMVQIGTGKSESEWEEAKSLKLKQDIQGRIRGMWS